MYQVKEIRRIPILYALLVLTFLLSVSAIAALASGPISLDLFSGKLTEYERAIVSEIRLPRLLLAMIVGGVLALCGAVMQGLFRNPLADPGIAGVSTGAALGAVLSIALLPAGFAFTTPICAFIGALLTTILVWRLAQSSQGASVVMLLLAGVAISALGGAAMGYMSYVADDQALRDITLWQMGSVSGATNTSIILCLVALIVLSFVFARYSDALNAMLLGEAEARHLGIDVERLKFVLIMFCAVGVGVAVSASGIIGFVGLVVPHCVRMVLGPDHKTLLPVSMLCGALLLSLADLFARLWISPAELPIGLVTALLGAPFFFILLIQQRQRFQY